MTKKIVLSILFFSFVFVIFTAIKKEEKTVCFKKDCFYVEVARYDQERREGLMYRKSLERNKGMIFVFKEEGVRSFWMKNTLIPLDMVWINENKEVVDIFKNVQPCKEKCKKITSDKKAKYVLEINAGQTESINLKIGDKLDFDIN